MLAYEKLRVYRRSIDFLALADGAIDKLPKGNSIIVDQLRRAALSIPLNIAEGTGKTTRTESARFYGIARGSSMECGAIFDACRVLGLANPETVDEAKNLLEQIVRMLSKMCR